MLLKKCEIHRVRDSQVEQIKFDCFNKIHLLYAVVVLLLAPGFAIYTFIVRYFCTGINKSQTADMYAPSTVNGDTMTGELSSMSDEKSDVNFDANDYVVSAISQYVLSNK